MAGKRRRVHSAIDEEEDKEVRIDEQRARQVRRSSNRRYIIQQPRSPKKKNLVQASKIWTPNADIEHWDIQELEEWADEGEGAGAGKDMSDFVCLAQHKRSAASDDPLREWYPYREEFVQESLRLEAQSEEARAGICIGCRDKSTTEDGVRRDDPMGDPKFRCLECFSSQNECLDCCLLRHRSLPLHRIEVWNGRCFAKTSLQALSLCIQLGHGGGKCTNPARAAKVFTVLHVNGVHLVSVDYCDCEMRVPRRTQLLRAGWYPATIHYPATCATIELLKHFHGLSLCSKVSAYEYYLNLERLTDNSRVDVPKTRYKAFLRMVRQFRHERMLKRAGRGNIENGVASTAAGDLALTCLACPQPGINLPNDWQTISPALRFLYTLFVSVDANFRLKNRLRKNELLDPGLHTGLAYFVPQAPYTEHILKHVSQTDISSCSGFAAMSRADSKSTQGLRYTGVGMCICARHELVRPLGVGDLQKGERYCNMDYIVLSALTNLALHALMIIYDIACQWGVNFRSRMTVLPSSLHISPTVQVTYAIPKCHLHAHQISCQSPNSLNLKPGVGRTDGEGIERDWSLINPAANSTKEMGAGSRHDTLDDLFGYHNWLKTTGLGLSLHRKYVLAVIEAKRHKGFHEELTASIEIPGLVENWTAAIVAWENDKAQPNPYITTTSHESENDVKLRLMEMDKAEARAGGAQVHDKSATVFLSTGLSIEESQRRLRLQASEKELTSIQAGKLEEKRAALRRQIKHFRTIQRAYMPSLAIPLENSQCAEAEDMALHLPSSLDLDDRSGISTLAMKEEELREAQCQDALERIRLTQRAKRHLVAFKKKSQPGQRSGTRARSSFDQLEAKLGQAVAKYRMAHAALSNLRGPGEWITTLPVLRNEDICPPPSFDIFDDTPASNMREAAERLGEGRREVSWIWRTAGVGDGADEELMAGVRIEWAKSRARALRWSEEILLCKEEMRRVRQSLEYRAKQWTQRSEPWSAIEDATLAQGVSAYAHTQVNVYVSLLRHFTKLWEESPEKQRRLRQGPAPGSAQAAAAEDEALMTELLASPRDEDTDGTDDDGQGQLLGGGSTAAAEGDEEDW